MKSAQRKTLSRRLLPGFTLIELLVVMGILAVLMAIVLIAINPTRQFQQANDAKRANDVHQILNAISAYSADNRGALPAGIPTAPTAAANISNGGANLCAAIMPTYIPALPQDPSYNGGAGITTCTTYDTHYTVQQDVTGRVTVSAIGQITNPIQVTR